MRPSIHALCKSVEAAMREILDLCQPFKNLWKEVIVSSASKFVRRNLITINDTLRHTSSEDIDDYGDRPPRIVSARQRLIELQKTSIRVAIADDKGSGSFDTTLNLHFKYRLSLLCMRSDALSPTIGETIRLTSFTDVGLSALMRITSEPDQPHSTAELAAESGISRNHSNKELSALAAAGFAEIRRGMGRGAVLAMIPEAMRLGDVVAVFERNTPMVSGLATVAALT